MERTLRKIIDYAVDIAEPETVILFGSMANESSNVFSDVDLLIISDKTSLKKHVIEKLVSYSGNLSLKIDVLFYSSSEIELECQNPDSFIAAIIESGKVVYKDDLKMTSI